MRTAAAMPLQGLAAAVLRAGAGDGSVRRERSVLTIWLVQCYLRAWVGEPESVGLDVLKRVTAGGSPHPRGAGGNAIRPSSARCPMAER